MFYKLLAWSEFMEVITVAPPTAWLHVVVGWHNQDQGLEPQIYRAENGERGGLGGMSAILILFPLCVLRF